MNAKRLRSITISVLALILPAGAAFAQSLGAYFKGDPFLRGRNVCGVAIDPPVGLPKGPYRASSASLYAGIEEGDFCPGYSSSSIWKMGAEARTDGISYNGRTFMTGTFSFEERHGKDMMTSMFINPGYYPIDVLEFTPGDKMLQTYRFSGGIRQNIGDRWRIGGKMDFASQNYAKRKDIRHTNYALDLTVAPSVLWNSPIGWLGLSGIFRKTSESIEAEQVGAATADTYMAFFDKGLRYGTLQAWDGAGIHLAEAGVNRLPVREFSYGAAVQYQRSTQSPWSPWHSVYADAEYLRTSGSVGEKGYDWYRFPGHKVAANGTWEHRWPGFTSRLGVHFGWRGQRLEESVMDKVTDGGVTLPTVYGWNLVSRRRQTDIAPALQLNFVGAARPTPVLRTMTLGYAGVIMDEQASPSYPYTDRWHAALHRVHATAGLGLPFGGAWNRFGLTLGARLLWARDREYGLQAFGKPVPDGADVTSFHGLSPAPQANSSFHGLSPAPQANSSFHGLSVESLPTRLTNDWIRKHEYITASAAELNGSIRYNLAAIPGMYLSADAAWLHAYRVTYLLGKNRLTATLRLGYEF